MKGKKKELKQEVSRFNDIFNIIQHYFDGETENRKFYKIEVYVYIIFNYCEIQ